MMIETAMPQLDITQVIIYTPRGVILGVYGTRVTYDCHLQLFVVKAYLSSMSLYKILWQSNDFINFAKNS